MSDKVYIVGAGGFSAEITEYIVDNNDHLDHEIEISGYFDLKNDEYEKYKFNAPYLGDEREYNLNKNSKFIIAISNPKLRGGIYDDFKKRGCEVSTFIHHSCFISKSSSIAEGAIICPFVTITSNAKIGVNFQANIYSYVAHDCIIGNNVTFAPGVKCNGNVEIKDNVYIGTGVIIKQGKSSRPIVIGKDSIISAGAVITKNVPDGTTVFGNPAIKLTKENLKKRS
mgnify:CR=1 FL=1